MKFSALSRTGFAVALSAVFASLSAPAKAESVDSIFAKVSPSVRDRMFFRLNYIYANVKSSSGEAYDVTGPVISRGDIEKYLGPGNTSGTQNGASHAAKNDSGTYKSPYYPTRDSSTTVYGGGATSVNARLFGAVDDDAALGYTATLNGLGTPDGVKAKSDESVATPALSVGYFLTDDYTWFVEAYVLAAPLKVNVQGDGLNGRNLPNGINGVNIIQTKLLPPTAILGYYFGKQTDRLRPFVGVGGSYAMFFDVRATDALNTYEGGDTSISLKNSLGFGPFLGIRSAIDDTWHVSFSVGKLRYKTEATLTTRNTVITAQSGVIADYGPNVYIVNTDGANAIARTYHPTTDVVTALMCDLAATKYRNDNCNLGTYERKQSTVLDNTMFMFSVGRSF